MELSMSTLLVNFSRPNVDSKDGLLIVGRKLPNQAVEIINAISGDEAEVLYKKLITKKTKEGSN